MGFMDLTCTGSVSLINGIQCFTYNNDKLRIGQNFITYLSFELPPAVFFTPLKEAKLILFKLPMKVLESAAIPWRDQYAVFPLLDYFSVYSSWYMLPRFDDSLRVDYEDQPHMSYTEIDITTIAAAWSEEKLENRGLVLTGVPNGRELTYASDQYETVGMRPRIRLTYEGISKPLSMAPCIVEVR